MKLNKSLKKSYLFVIIVFCFLRSVLFASNSFFKGEKLSLNFVNILFLILAFLCSVLTAALIYTAYKKCENKSWLPCLLLVLDPTFLISQRYTVNLIVYFLWLLYLNNRLREKPIVTKEAAQFVFLLAATIVSPKIMFAFLPLVILIELISGINNGLKNKQTVIVLLVSVISIACGITGNKFIYSNSLNFRNFTDFSNFSQVVEKNGVVTVLLLSVPSLVAGAYFFYLLLKDDRSAKAKNKKKAKKAAKTKTQSYNESKKITKAQLLFYTVCAAYILLLFGGIFLGRGAIGTFGLVAPVVILASLALDNDTAIESTVSDIEKFILKHSAVFVFVFILLIYIEVKIIMADLGGNLMATFFVWGG